MSKDFDKLLKSKLENHESEFPSDMWGAIDSAINPVQKAPRYGLWAMFGLGITSLILGLLYINISDGEAIIETEPSLSSTSATTLSDLDEKQVTISDLVKKEDSLDATLFAEDKKENQQVLNQDLEINNEEIVINTSASKSSFASQEEVFVPSNSSLALANTSARANSSASASTSTSINSDANSSVGVNSNANVTAKSSGVIRSKNSEIKTTEKNITKRKISFSEPLLQGSSSELNNAFSAQKLKKDVADDIVDTKQGNSNNASFQNLLAISKIPSLYEKMESRTAPQLDLGFRAAATDCPSWVHEKLGLYLEAYYAPEYGIRSLTAKSRDSLVVANQNIRNETEEALLSFSFGARAMFLTPSGISFKLGVNYSQINERFTWQDPESIRETTVHEIDAMTGDTINTFVTFEFGTEVEERINKYKSIDLPILIGYDKYLKKKLSLTMNAGIYLNMIAIQRGMFIDPEGNRAWFSSQDGDVDAYERSLGVSFYVSGGLLYHWVPGIDLFVQPSVRYYNKSLTLDSYPLNQNYAVIGLNTGIRYKF